MNNNTHQGQQPQEININVENLVETLTKRHAQKIALYEKEAALLIEQNAVLLEQNAQLAEENESLKGSE
jgi:hypothetical protein